MSNTVVNHLSANPGFSTTCMQGVNYGYVQLCLLLKYVQFIHYWTSLLFTKDCWIQEKFHQNTKVFYSLSLCLCILHLQLKKNSIHLPSLE